MKVSKKTKMMKAAARSIPEEDPEFQIAPMIDILLVLLIFFMSISSSEVLQQNQSVVLPVAKDAGPPSKDTKGGQAVINILWNNLGNSGTIELEEKKYGAPDQLTPLLSARTKDNPSYRVLIRADKNVKYEYLRSVMLAAANGGIANVTFSVVDRDSDKGAPKP
jgi:biopolymer transport protein ExbD